MKSAFHSMSMHYLTTYARLAAGVIALVLVAFVMPESVWAETAAPAPNLKKAPPAWLGMFVMFVLMALVLGVSLLPSKRGHQD